MAIEVTIRTREFPCETWLIRDGEEIQPIPGTWTYAPMFLRQTKGIKGILCCPECGIACLLHKDMGEKADDPKHMKLAQWHCDSCGYECSPVILDWDRRKLHCAAFETIQDGKVIPHKEYLHAESIQEATAAFWAGHPPSDKITKLVGVAPVIGFYVLDNEGKKLTV